MIGEIGGSAEEEAAAFAKATCHQTGRRLHRRPHRTSRQTDGARRCDHQRRQRDGGEKVAALEAAGIVVAPTPADMGEAVVKAMGKVA